MFILRTITPEKQETNQILGNRYHLVSIDQEPDYFDFTLKSYFTGIGLQEDRNVFAFLKSDGIKEDIPLYKTHYHYIMLSDGKTFANLTIKCGVVPRKNKEETMQELREIGMSVV